MDKHEYIKLVNASLAGDLQAQTLLLEVLAVRLATVVKHRVGWWPVQEQEDLIQSTLTVFLEKLNEIRDNPCAFVVQILANQIGNELQKKRRRTEIPIVDDSSNDDFKVPGVLSLSHSRELASDSSAERLVDGHEVQDVIHAIDKLSPFCRTVFKGIVEGLPINEILDSIRQVEPKLSRSAFDKRIFDCRKNLRLLMATQNK